VRQDANQSERNLRRPCSYPTYTIRDGKSCFLKALTIAGADRFNRCGGICRLHAISMNQFNVIWGYREELSSRSACPHAEDIRLISSPA
jgi:hypothetical protein